MQNEEENMKDINESINNGEASELNQELLECKFSLDLEKEQLRIMLSSIGDGVISTDNDGNVTFLNIVAEKLTGWSNESALGRPLAEVFVLVDEHTKERVDNHIIDVLNTMRVIELESNTILIAKDGTERFIADSIAPVINSHADMSGVIFVFRDITERKKIEEALAKSEKKYKMLAENVSDVISVFNITKDKFTYDDRLSPEALVNARREMEKNVKHFIEHPNEEKYFITESQQVCKNGSIIWVETSRKYQYNEDGEIESVNVIRKIDDRKKAEEQLLYVSYHDQLTGLYNRRFYEEEMNRINTERNIPITLIMADVNGLKLTNDSFGHQAEDLLLQKAANVFKRECRADEIIARIGGDEFVILLPQTDSVEAKNLINRISEAISKESKGNLIVSISMGFAVKEKATDNINDVFKQAEDEMYKQKLSESANIRIQTIDLIMKALYEKLPRELVHSENVSAICESIATKLNLEKEDINQIKIAGLMHDIGKIGIDDSKLNKAGNLTIEELRDIERHSEIGYRILRAANEFTEIAQYVHEHHEKWNGGGYPKGLKSEEISLGAKIIAVANLYDLLTSEKPSGEGLEKSEALQRINESAGEYLDPELVKIFVDLQKEC
jgi:diguanylate cyclase (GGDEF)-like protein/PAS domain S-box-containing protein/putative nucleotidyltransferase with HDIG domain